METTKETIEALASELGLTMKTVFVPFSNSRNKGEESLSLNWRITLQKNGRDFLTTDYMAGIGHCPGYAIDQREHSVCSRDLIKWECENGFEGRIAGGGCIGRHGSAILPSIADVLYSLVMDASALDYSSFEEWADSMGEGSDSRKAEKAYQSCLKIGLKLRNTLGANAFKQLQEATRDY